MSDSGPIFIVGAPRSGTSMLRNMLNRHPSIWLCDETRFDYQVYIRRKSFGELSIESNRRLLVDRYMETKAADALGYAKEDLSAALMRDGDSYRNFFKVLTEFGAKQMGRPRVGEKTPGHALITETLCEWFPDCTLIHIIRDPRDVASSLKKVPFGSRHVASNARQWLNHVSAAQTSAHRENYIQIQYEKLIANPEAVLSEVLEKAGERFDPGVLEASAAEKGKKWWFHRAAGPLDRTRVERWRKNLSDNEIAVVEWVAGQKMEELGYARATSGLSTLARVRARIMEVLDWFWIRTINIPTLWYYWVEPTKLSADARAWDKRMDRRESTTDQSV